MGQRRTGRYLHQEPNRRAGERPSPEWLHPTCKRPREIILASPISWSAQLQEPCRRETDCTDSDRDSRCPEEVQGGKYQVDAAHQDKSGYGERQQELPSATAPDCERAKEQKSQAVGEVEADPCAPHVGAATLTNATEEAPQTTGAQPSLRTPQKPTMPSTHNP